MSTDPDSDVLTRVANGDMEGATRLLMQRYGTKVYGYCRQQLRDATLAEDVNQTVFEQVYRDFPRFDRKSTVRTWLYSIAHHRVLDAIKARRRQDKHVDRQSAVDKNHPDDKLSAGERIDETRLQQALTECLELLPPEVRTAVLLRFLLGLSFEEMAKMLGVRPGTLEARVRRAKPWLRDCIEDRTGGVV